ncbi:MAG: pilus assembly PilX family protein [Gammaproteobacteria bacterium]
MINFYRNPLNQCKGGAILIVTIMLLVTTTLIIIFAANQGIILQKISSNQNQKEQAFEAAEAGLAYAINYLQQNSATILAGPVNGYIPAFSNNLTTNVTLANNSKYSFTYTNPIQNNYNLITITSTGTSSDGSSTRVVSEQVQFGSMINNPGTIALTGKGTVSMTGDSTVTNTTTNQTILSGSTVSLGGDSQTITSGGVSSTAGNIKSDITQSSATLSSESNSDFFSSYFGTSSSAIQSKVAHYYSNASNTNYSATLSGMTGTSIWIDQTGGTATINGSTTIGSAAQPVLLIVNGPLSLSGGVTIYGFVYVIGTTGIDTITGNTQIFGGLVTTDTLSMAGNINVTYNSSVLSALKNLNTISYYAPVSGSWKDF